LQMQLDPFLEKVVSITFCENNDTENKESNMIKSGFILEQAI
jgi:hypothetical protein